MPTRTLTTLYFCARFALLLCGVQDRLYSQTLDTVWTRLAGHLYRDYPYAIEATADGGAVMGGFSEETMFGEWYPFILRVGANGDTIWSTVIDSISGGTVKYIHELEFGDFLLGISRSLSGGVSGMSLMRTTGTGDYLWHHVYSSELYTELYAGTTDEFGNTYLVGTTTPESPSARDLFLVKADGVGEEVWRRTLNLGGEDIPTGVELAPTDGVVIAGASSGGQIGHDGFLLRVEAGGDSQWTSFSGVVANDGYNSIRRVGTNYICSAYHPDVNGIGASIVKLDQSGNILWRHLFGSWIGDEEGQDAVPMPDGRFLMTGYTRSFGVNAPDYSNVALWVVSAQGDSLDMMIYGDSLAERGMAMDQGLNGRYYVAARNSSTAGTNADYWVLALETPEGISRNASIAELTGVSAFPNPFNSSTTLSFDLPSPTSLTVTVFDITGREVMTTNLGTLSAGTHAHNIDATKLPSGIYFARITPPSLSPSLLLPPFTGEGWDGGKEVPGIGVTLKLAHIR